MLTRVVVDLDGTLADNDHRQHILDERLPDGRRDWAKFHSMASNDAVHEDVANLVRMLYYGMAHRKEFSLEIWTARDDTWRRETIRWLREAEIPYTRLRMRPAGDYRSSEVIKQQMLDECGFIPQIVLEDRDKMVKFFREQGITCLAVADNAY